MSYVGWIALRQVFSRRRKAGISFMTIASVIGTMIGVAALIIVLSVMGGFEKDLKGRIFKGLPHLEILSSNPSVGFSLDKVSLEQMREVFPAAEVMEPFTRADLVFKHDRRLASVTLFGIEPNFGGRPWGFSEAITSGSIGALSQPDPQTPSLILGEALALQLGVEVDDFVTAISPQMNISDALAGHRFTQVFKVVGIFKTDIPNYDSKYAVTDLSSGRKFMEEYEESLDAENYISGIAATFDEPERIDSLEYSSLMPEGLKVVTWKDVNKSLLVALKLEKFAMGAVLFLIVLVAAFSISGTIMMTVYYKRNQVALLRALGMKSSEILQLFLTHGLIISAVGVSLGFLVGFSACFLIDNSELLKLPQGVYLIKKLPIRFLGIEYVIIGLGAFFISLAASIYPALKAARQDPGAGLRYS
jgi:lipoprotein-releasing system permease protein